MLHLFSNIIQNILKKIKHLPQRAGIFWQKGVMYLTVYPAGTTPALRYARQHLQKAGISVSGEPGLGIDHLLLDVPSFRPGSGLQLDTLLASLPSSVTIWGGNLNHPSLAGYRCRDLLKNEDYLMQNAQITAQCTIPIIAPLIQNRWQGLPVLITGWGRITKHLAPLLGGMGCSITIAARKEAHRAEAEALGFRSADTAALQPLLPEILLIINTVPALLLSESDLQPFCHMVKIDLASLRGLEGRDVVWARGLPGIHAPEQSGQLIAETFLQLVKEEKP